MRVLRTACLLAGVLFCSVPNLAVGTQAAAPGPPPAGETRFDGPAELPRVYVKSTLADTPAPGKVRLVRNNGNLQAALDSAACGDIIELEAGAVFAGHFLLPQKPCDDGHWIVIRTSAPDDALP